MDASGKTGGIQNFMLLLLSFVYDVTEASLLEFLVKILWLKPTREQSSRAAELFSRHRAAGRRRFRWEMSRRPANRADLSTLVILILS